MTERFKENENDLILLEIISQKFKEQLELVVLLASTSNQSSHDYERKKNFLNDILNFHEDHDLFHYILNDSITNEIDENYLNYTLSIENAKKSLEKVFEHLLSKLTSKFARLAEILRNIRVNAAANSKETKIVEIKLDKKENCNRCEQKFNSLNDLVIHSRSHKNERFKCDKCDGKFTCLTDLNFHCSKMHTNVTSRCSSSFKCENCPKEFKRKCHLILHSRRLHNTRKSFLLSRVKVIYKKLKNEHHECYLCKKKFFHEKNFNDHAEMHMDEIPLRCLIYAKFLSGEKPYGCNKCGRTFSKITRLIKHIDMHTREKYEYLYGCETCGKRFLLEVNLRIHSRTHLEKKIDSSKKSTNENSGQFKCENCPKKFNSNYLLILHCLKHKRRKLVYSKVRVLKDQSKKMYQDSASVRSVSLSKNLRKKLHPENISVPVA
jgi:hypothetical protein